MKITRRNRQKCLTQITLGGLFLALASLGQGADLSLAIEHTVAGNPLLIESLRYETRAEETFSVSRLSYLLTDFALESSDGKWVEIEGSVAWVDPVKHRNQFELSHIPEGDYRAIRFHIGPDISANHSDPAQFSADHPLNPNLNQLHWTWATGYIFMALEGRYRLDGELRGFVYHLANDWNRQRVSLPVQLSIKRAAAVEIGFDLANLWNSPEPITFAGDGHSTHSKEGDPIALKLSRNLPSAFQILRVLDQSPKTASAKALPIDLPDHYEAYPLKISRRIPFPALPNDNPLIKARVDLGEKLFFDPILSADGTVNCASCHDPDLAFSDPTPLSSGMNGALTRRHSMPLFNLGWKSRFFWDGRSPSLREQVIHPITHPDELGASFPELKAKLGAIENYRRHFAAAFGSGEITEGTIALALEAYLLTLISHDSKFDQAMLGKTELSEAEKRGFELFMTEFEPRSGSFGADCFHCHGGGLFSDHQFHNNGLKTTNDRGLAEFTGKESDLNKFATPSLRNVGLTAPYMHDGRFATLEEVVAHYNSGLVRSATLDPNLAKHPRGGLGLSEADQAALVAFLHSLSDPQYLEE